jgi:hypothetical protein
MNIYTMAQVMAVVFLSMLALLWFAGLYQSRNLTRLTIYFTTIKYASTRYGKPGPRMEFFMKSRFLPLTARV